MDDHIRFPPPVVPPEPAAIDAEGAGPARWAHPVILFAVAAAISIVAAVAVGVVVGFVVGGASTSNCSPNDGWCDLGAAVFGLLAGAAAALVTYVVTGVVTIFRHRPSGSRAMHVVAHLALPVVLLTLGGVAGTIV